MSKKVDPALQRAVQAEQQKQLFNEYVHQLTDQCWDLCNVKIAEKMDNNSQTCIVNCVNRFLDASGLIVNQLQSLSISTDNSIKEKTTIMNLFRCISRLQPSLVSSKYVTNVRFMGSANTAPTIINIQGMQDFRTQVLESKTPVLVDFHATWCGPCKLLGPRLETLMTSYAEQVVLAKVDIDEIEDAPIHYNVTSVPTVVGIKGGEEVGRFVGLQEEDAIRNFIDKML